jgi:hypothetical protein
MTTGSQSSMKPERHAKNPSKIWLTPEFYASERRQNTPNRQNIGQ